MPSNLESAKRRRHSSSTESDSDAEINLTEELSSVAKGRSINEKINGYLLEEKKTRLKSIIRTVEFLDKICIIR